MTDPTKPKTLGELALRDLQNRTNHLKQTFAAVTNQPERVLLEAVFKEHFLPWFAGEKPDVDGQKRANWLRIAGTHYEPVGLLNLHGQVVAMVPPLKDRNVVPIKIRDRQDQSSQASQLLYQAELTNHLSPNLANQQLYRGLREGYLGAPGTQDTTSELTRQWQNLLALYGKGQATAVQVKDVQADDDFWEFE